MEDLTFVRIIDPNVFKLIPRSLFEQIEELDDDAIDRIYQQGSAIATVLIPNEQGQLVRVPNPVAHLAVLVDEKPSVQGFLWAQIDVIKEQIFVQAYTVAKKHQGQMRKRAEDYLFNLPIDEKYKRKIQMLTSKPKVYERFGWKRSEKVLMEICNDNHTTRTEPVPGQ